MPFVLLGLALLPAVALIYSKLPPDAYKLSKEETKPDVTMRTLLKNPQVVVICIASMLANSDYAFLEPTLGEHAQRMGLASGPDSIGLLFSVASVTYTLSCPVIGILASRERLGPRIIIVGGLVMQLFGFLLIGPAPFLGSEVHFGQMVVSLVLFGVGESMSMTPVMDDMMHSCGELADASVNSLSSMMAASFSLGQMIGPLIGSGLTSRMGFPWACSLMAVVLMLHTTAVFLVDVWSPRARVKDGGYQELKAINVPNADSAVD